jgi:hypothetical protein
VVHLNGKLKQERPIDRRTHDAGGTAGRFLRVGIPLAMEVHHRGNCPAGAPQFIPKTAHFATEYSLQILPYRLGYA